MQYIKPDDREKWDSMLVAPLPGQEKRKPSEAEMEAEGASFMALMQTEAARKKERANG